MIIQNRKGFTKVEFFIVISIVVLIAGGVAPLIHKSMNDSKRAQAKSGAVEIAMAVPHLFNDVGHWPSTDRNGPSWGPGVNRLASDPSRIPQGQGQGAQKGALGWGNLGKVKSLDDFLYYNNPDDDIGSGSQNQEGQDYPTTGEFKWNGPYLERPNIVDPWGQSYVVNARYFPNNPRLEVVGNIGFMFSQPVRIECGKPHLMTAWEMDLTSFRETI